MRKFALTVIALAVFAASAYASDISNRFIHPKVQEMTNSGGVSYGTVYPARCTTVSITDDNTDSVIMKIPTPTNYTIVAPIVDGTTYDWPAQASQLRYYFGGLSLQLDAAAGAAKSVAVTLTARCVDAAHTNTTAVVTVTGAAATYADSAQYTCQDETFPSPVTLSYTATAGGSATEAHICFQKFTVRDPCYDSIHTILTETAAVCGKY